MQLITLVLFVWLGVFHTASLQNDGDLVGQVTDPTGTALPGVTVRLQEIGGQRQAQVVVTDAEGAYSFGCLHDGSSYEVSFLLDGFTGVTFSPIVFRFPETRLLSPSMMPADPYHRLGFRIFVTVVDSRSDSVSGAVVTVVNEAGEVAGEGESDACGRLEVGVARGRYSVVVSKDDYKQFVSTPIDVPAVERLSIVLERED